MFSLPFDEINLVLYQVAARDGLIELGNRTCLIWNKLLVETDSWGVFVFVSNIGIVLLLTLVYYVCIFALNIDQTK